MVDQRIELVEAELLTVAADALVVEDDGSLQATRGLAALVEQHYGLQAERERAVQDHGATFPIGSAVATLLQDDTGPRAIVWAVTFTQGPSAADRVRATPLDVAAASRAALHQAAATSARHVAMSALGTRIGYHALPPTPKKLPRYVMAAAQLIGVQTALEALPMIERVTICLTQRDRGIFEDVLGRTQFGAAEGSVNDD